MDSIKAKVSKAKDGITIDLAGDQFTLDTRYAMLIDKGDPMNSISIQDMSDRSTHYELLYDREQRNLAEYWEPQANQVTLPQLLEIDPKGLSEKYGITPDNLPSRDAALRMDEQYLMERLDGKLPQIIIEGKLYDVDINVMLLRDKNISGKDIDLSSLRTTFDGRFMGYYNTLSKTITNLDDVSSGDPNNTKMVMIPSREWLDPVYAARSMNLPETALQKDFPAMALHQAKSYPLSESAKLVIAELHGNKRLNVTKETAKQDKPKRKKGYKL